ncbi:hypothetical protein FPJ27_14800 [Burkholderia sp. MS455]|uniref:hypothetical protein n=1 Tax=Burkholderia sp. MS455 TaxID=2811788 RepID=UPI00195AF0C4|nr:hypothetical protein [Burkholderia sp. MS455]QRR07565.1 hypothetical protein FPJ27_14800 [Burkholderia sp. MS455]
MKALLNSGLIFLVVVQGLNFPLISHAQEVPYPDPGGFVQCSMTDINDSKQAAGSCTPANPSAPGVAIYSAQKGTTPSVLAPLVSGQSCSGGAMPNSGVVIGVCATTNNFGRAVVWTTPGKSSVPPVALNPLPILTGLNLVPDVSTGFDNYNQHGDVVGESVSAGGNDTVVFWPAGGYAASPVLVSAYGDNCVAADINDAYQNGRPGIALNCPTNSSPANPGPMIARIAQNTSCLLGVCGYGVTSLQLPAGATHCTVASINDSLQSVGTCHFPAPDHPQSAYWATPSSGPVLLNLPNGAVSIGRSINATGHIVFVYRDPNGFDQPGFWAPSNGTIISIPPVAGGSSCSPSGFSDIDKMALTCETSDQHVVAASWSRSTGMTAALGFVNGGANSALTAESRSGNAVVGNGETSGEKSVGFEDDNF